MIEKLRMIVSRTFAVFLFILICSSGSLWKDTAPFLTSVLFLIGMMLVGIGAMGRLWCSVYIAGYKTDKLITQGPYSMCRNPLYFFSFLGVIGVGLASETLLIPLAITVAFFSYYPFVIKSEEKRLLKLHTKEFETYIKRVPSFFPKISLLQEPDEYIMKPIIFKMHIFSAFWFVGFVGILKLIEGLHELKIIPIIFKIY